MKRRWSVCRFSKLSYKIVKEIRIAQGFLNRVLYHSPKYPTFFLEPCNHKLFNESNCLKTMTGLGRRSYERALSYICNRYRSKKHFESVTDPYGDKEFAIYYHRLFKHFIILRNPNFRMKTFGIYQKVSDVAYAKYLKSLVLEKDVRPRDKKDNLINNTPIIPSRDKRKFKIRFSRQGIPRRKLSPFLQEAYMLWMKCFDLVQGKIPSSKKLTAVLGSFIEKHCANRLDEWKRFIRWFSQSDFLSGRLEMFKFNLSCLCPSTFLDKILQGKYHAEHEGWISSARKELPLEINEKISDFLENHLHTSKLQLMLEKVGKEVFYMMFVKHNVNFEETRYFAYSELIPISPTLPSFMKKEISQKFKTILRT